MSDSMIERVAIAIATSHLNDPPDPVCVFDFYALTGDIAEKYYAMARAAIEAMREPTEQMIDAGVEARMRLYKKMEAEGVNTRTVVVANHPAGTIYEAMIDRALKD